MAEEKKKKSRKDKKASKTKDKKKQGIAAQIKIGYNNLEDPKKFYRTVLLPLVIMGVLVFCMPIILGIV